MDSKRYLKPKDRHRGIWSLSLQDDEKVQAKEVKLTTWTFGAQAPHKVMVVRFQFKNHVAPLFLLGCLHALHSPSATYGGLLMSCSNP